MSRLSHGEREFVSDFGELPGSSRQPTTAPMPAAGAGGVRELDARRLAPPLALVEAHRTVRGLRAGELLRVITSDPRSMEEFQALAKYEHRLELVSQDVAGEDFVHLLRKRR